MSTQPRITVESALETIDQALATINTNRAGHIALQRCMEVIRAEMEAYKVNIESLSADRAGLQEQVVRRDAEWAHALQIAVEENFPRDGREWKQWITTPDTNTACKWMAELVAEVLASPEGQNRPIKAQPESEPVSPAIA